MGTFRIEVQAVGGHGCQREIGEGETVPGCGQATCPDCIARRFVAELRDRGSSVESARLVHWPATPSEVRDDLVSGKRSGAFTHPHRETEHIEQFFAYGHLPPHLQEVSRPFCLMAGEIMRLPRSPERTVALRKLLESKDAAVRAALAK